MKPFAGKNRSGDQFIGIALSNADLMCLAKREGPLAIDLGSIGVGLWVKEVDGTRRFLQPRDTNVVIIGGDTNEEIGELLGLDMTSLDEEKD